MNQNTGRILIFVGVAIVVVGILMYFLGDKMNWLGRLPGDIRIERENVKFYFPIVTMIILSLLLTLVVNLIKRFL